MIATMVGMEWGMAALGINPTPRKARESVVRAEGVTKHYGAHAAVSNASPEVRHGDICDLLEPRGSAKSMPIGQVQPSAGSVAMVGDATTWRATGLRRIGVIIESPTITSSLSGRDDLKALPRLRPRVLVALTPFRRPSTVCSTGSLQMHSDTEHTTRPEIIRAVHGVTPTGNWFLLADVAPTQPYRDELAAPTESAFDASWLVVLGRRDRDIITFTLQGEDA